MDEVKSQLLSLFVQYLAPLLYTGVLGMVGWMLHHLRAYFQAKAAESKLFQVGARLTDLADSVVADLEATMKPELQAAVADGVLTKAEITRLREVALGRLKQLAGEKGLGEILSVLKIAAPGLDVYLNGIIEKAVAKLSPANP